MPNPPKPLFLGPLRPIVFRPPRGRKPIYLPNFTLTLLRTPFLPPTFASFLVPLNFNKLDLKDYLFHVYNVPVLSIRSYIQQQRVRQDKPGAKYPRARKWFRPRAVKRMTVEMGSYTTEEGELVGGAFVWPKKLQGADLEPWDKDVWDAAQEAQKKENERFGPEAGTLPKRDRKSMAEQAKAILEGKMKWRPSWTDFGRPLEVETNVNIN